MKELSWQCVVLVLGFLGIVCCTANSMLKTWLFRPVLSNNPRENLMGTPQPGIEEKAMQDYKERKTCLQENPQENPIIKDMNRCIDWNICEEDFYFVSYSSKNIRQVKTLKRLLQDKNIHVWIAPDCIPQGREYTKVISTALKYAKNFIILLTPDAAESDWVKTEIDIAKNNKNIKIKVVLSDGFTIDDVERNDDLNLYFKRVQIKPEYEYSKLVHSSERLKSFLSE